MPKDMHRKREERKNKELNNESQEGVKKNNINWYPGHMAKAKRELEEYLPLVDAVVELLDARIPQSSQNPDFSRLFRGKPNLTLMTKTSLADPQMNRVWLSRLRESGRNAYAIDCKTAFNPTLITGYIKSCVADKLARNAAKGISKPVRVLVCGITNVGKSTFINTYTKTKKAKAENRPGVTRSAQWIASPYAVELLDTPGLLWHKFDDESVAVKLCLTGSIRDEILDCVTMAVLLVRELRGSYSPLLCARYGVEITDTMSDADVFAAIARKRGFLVAGGEINEEAAATMLLSEFRTGKIGAITLDR